MRTSIFTFFLLLGSIAMAQNCFPDWDYYRSVSIHNPSTESLSDIQVLIELDLRTLIDSSKLQTDGADLRITDESCTPLPFYVNTGDTAIDNNIWVRIPSLPANDSIFLQLYYGNDSTNTLIDGDATFLFFDDFTESMVDTNKWETVGGFNTFRITNGSLEYASSGMNPGPRFKFARTKSSFSEAAIFDFKAKVSNSNGFGFSSADTILDRIIFRQSGFGFDTMNQVAYNRDTIDNGFSISQTYPIIRFPRGEFRDGSIHAGIENNLLNLTRFANLNDNSVNSDTFQLTQTEMGSFHYILSSFIGFSVFLDYLQVRKPIPELVYASVGEEEGIISSAIGFPDSQSSIRIYPNPASEYIIFNGLEAGNYSFQLVNSLGQSFLNYSQRSYEGEEVRISFQELTDGIYWILLKNEAGQRVSTAIVIRK